MISIYSIIFTDKHKILHQDIMAHLVSFSSLVYIFLLCSCSPNQVTSEVYYIKSNSNSSELCISPCLSLSQLFFPANLNHSNTTLIFLPGTHYLIFSMSVSRAKVFSMTSKSTTVQVVCRSSNIRFDYSQYISISMQPGVCRMWRQSSKTSGRICSQRYKVQWSK